MAKTGWQISSLLFLVPLVRDTEYVEQFEIKVFLLIVAEITDNAPMMYHTVTFNYEK